MEIKEHIFALERSHVMKLLAGSLLSGNIEGSKENPLVWSSRVPLFDYSRGFSLARPQCETNKEYLQILPYIVIEDEVTGKYLSYKRGNKGAEERLHDLYSIGVGGHVKTGIVSQELVVPFDRFQIEKAGTGSYVKILSEQIDAELQEEVGLVLTNVELKEITANFSSMPYQHVIYVDDGDVSSYHLCLPIFIKLDRKERLVKYEQGVIENVSWLTPDELKTLNLEPWSRTIINGPK